MEDTQQAVSAMNAAAESTARLLLFLRERGEASADSTNGERPSAIPNAPAVDASAAKGRDQ